MTYRIEYAKVIGITLVLHPGSTRRFQSFTLRQRWLALILRILSIIAWYTRYIPSIWATWDNMLQIAATILGVVLL